MVNNKKHYISGPDPSDKNPINKIKIDNNKVIDPVSIANEFNKFFVNIGPNLANQIPQENGDISGYLKSSFQKSMGAIHTDQIEIQNITTQLKSSSSNGVDGVSAKIAKAVIEEISLPLATVFNLSLTNGYFPDKLKIAKVIPIYKSDDRLLINNYRPISVLPFFPKF